MSQNINQLNSELAETSQGLDDLSAASNNLKEQTGMLDEQLSTFIFEQNDHVTIKKSPAPSIINLAIQDRWS
jgi:uncharacterized phage infection (PIP) family protein YhgE